MIKNSIFWEKTYKKNLKSQRNFPNEELCRFLGRNYKNKKKINVLELGCGTGSNINAFIHHNMNITGIDISKESIKICKKKYKLKKQIQFLNLDMLEINKISKKFDLIVDIFSTYNLNLKENEKLLELIHMKLKNKGIFFCYTPSKNSTSWKKEKDKFDESTLKSFKRKVSPYFGNKGFFRFSSLTEIKNRLKKNSFKIDYSEIVSRTYNSTKEYFEFIVIEAKKSNDKKYYK